LPVRNDSAPAAEANVRLIVPLWASAVFFAVMNTTMFNVSLPAVIEGLGITPGMGSWVLSGYSITFAMATLVASRLSDFVPLRTLLTAGVVLMGAASVAGLAADRFAWLTAIRVVQAMGAGTVSGIGVIMVRRLVPFERRGRALSMLAAGSALSYGAGPIAGGFLTALFGWNAMFLVPCLILPLGLYLRSQVPKEKLPRQRFDATGAALTAAMSVLLLLALTQRSAALFAFGAALAALNAAYLLRVRDPFVALDVLRVPHYPKLVPLAMFAMGTNVSFLYLIPLMLDAVHGRGTAEIGLALLPGALLSGFMSRYTGRWVDRYGPRRVMPAAMLVLMAAVTVLLLFLHRSAHAAMAAYLLFSPGFSALMSSMNHEISTLVPREKLGSGAGLVQLLQFNGGAFGVALCGVLLDLNAQLPPGRMYAGPLALIAAFLVTAASFLLWYLLASRRRRAGDVRETAGPGVPA